MKTIAAIFADLERAPLGNRSLLAELLCGRPILRRTMERVVRAKSAESVHLICPAAQVPAVKDILAGLAIEVHGNALGAAPYAELVRTCRWWGLDAWRGGPASMCAFDEDIHLPIAHALADQTGADTVLFVAATAVLVDVTLLDEMVRHYEKEAEGIRLSFMQAPPGLGGAVLSRDLIAQLAPTGQPPGCVLTYQPDKAQADLTGREACYRPAASVIQARGRLLADTHRSVERLRELIEAGAEDWDAARIGSWLIDRSAGHVEAVPEEIEIELTTQDVLGDASLLRPRGGAVPLRGPISMDVVRTIAKSIGEFDDVRIVFAGFGEPCSHPQFGEICRVFREAGAAAIAVRTSALGISTEVQEAMFETPIDLVEVTLDAATAHVYRRVHGVDRYAEAIAQIDLWLARRVERQQVRPLIVPSMIKANETLDDLEAFFDHWQRRLGMSAVTGYSHSAGQRPPRAVTSMAPPQRVPCRRTFTRAMVLADGRMTTCDQDFAGKQALGSVAEKGLLELWRSAGLTQIRKEDYADAPLCRGCDEWHRP